MLFALSAGGVYAVLAHWGHSTGRVGASARAGEKKRSSKAGQVRVKKADNAKHSEPAVPTKSSGQLNKSSPPTPPATPLEVVQDAIKLQFGDEVRITRVSLDNGVLTLEGAITTYRQIQDAREVAVSALEDAGFGPISLDKVRNLLRKPPKE
jgi:hypothetical protein